MAFGALDKTLEQQIVDIVQRTLDDHYQGTLTFGPIRVQETDDMVTGEWYLHIYIVVDGDYQLLHDRWSGLLPWHIEPGPPGHRGQPICHPFVHRQGTNGHGSIRRSALITDDLLDIARRLAEGNPSQTGLRRAISSVYYACSRHRPEQRRHAGRRRPTSRDPDAWRQAYRALDHATPDGAANRHAAIPAFLRPFKTCRALCTSPNSPPPGDYDPGATFYQPEVLVTLAQIDEIIADFRAAPAPEHRAFAVYVLMRERQD